MSKYTKEENIEDYQKRLDDIYSKYIKKAQNTKEFEQNEMKINTIKNILVKQLDTPEELINWLIDSVSANKDIENKVITNKILKNFIK